MITFKMEVNKMKTGHHIHGEKRRFFQNKKKEKKTEKSGFTVLNAEDLGVRAEIRMAQLRQRVEPAEDVDRVGRQRQAVTATRLNLEDEFTIFISDLYSSIRVGHKTSPNPVRLHFQMKRKQFLYIP